MLRNRVKALRKEKGYTQEGLAELLGVSRQTVIAIENNRFNPSLELAIKISKSFDLAVEEVFWLE